MAATADSPRADRADIAAVRAVEQEGFALLPGVYGPSEMGAVEDALRPIASETPPHGQTQATRNVLAAAPQLETAWRTDMLRDLLVRTLGPGCGLVGVTFFDKPPGDSWSVPFHKDLSIAVKPGRVDSSLFSLPRQQDGVSVVEAPLSVLRSMLTLRIHLDDVTDDNGPLRVLVGSHATGKTLRVDGFRTAPIYAAAGDVLALRPLLAHASGHTRPGVTEHRRVLRLSFAANSELPDDFRWNRFVPVAD